MRFPFSLFTRRKNNSTVQVERSVSGGDTVRTQTNPSFLSSGVTGWGMIPFADKIEYQNKMRNLLPMIGAVVARYQALIGKPAIDTGGDKRLLGVLEDFSDNVQVGNFCRGLNLLADSLSDALVLNGAAFFEIAPSAVSRQGVARIIIPDLTKFSFRNRGNAVEMVYTNGVTQKVIDFNQFIIYTIAKMRGGDERGHGMFDDCEFMADTAFRIYEGIRAQGIRFGHASFDIAYKRSANETDVAAQKLIKKIYNQVVESAQAALTGKAKDVVYHHPNDAKLEIKVLGGQQSVYNFDLDLKNVAEQIISPTHFTPPLIGLYATQGEYALSKTQAEQIAVVTNDYRNIHRQVLSHIYNTHLDLIGMSSAKSHYKLVYPDVLTRDRSELAKALHLETAAFVNLLRAFAEMIEKGFMSEADLKAFLRDSDFMQMTKGERANIDAKITALFAQRNYNRAAEAWARVTGVKK